MKFGAIQKIKFGTDAGTYSMVTEREEFDSQITLTDYETELAVGHFGETILRGPVKSNPEQALKTFYLHGTGDAIDLNLVYPKPDRTELRLYLGSRAGFKPKPGEIWFLYLNDDKLFIGAMTEREWRRQERLDEDDPLYQAAIYEGGEILKTKIAARDAWKRDYKLARESLRLADFKCEFDPSHNLFIARSTLTTYVEAHHLVPMGLQAALDVKLDTRCNIFSLCPMCHSKVHHAINKTAAEVVLRLFERRENELYEKLHLTAEDLLRFYNCEEIKR
jgi:hypothetical protein